MNDRVERVTSQLKTMSHHGIKTTATPLTIPALASPNITYGFGRMDSDQFPVSRVLEITGQDTLSGMTFNTIFQMSTVQFEIGQEAFTRVWKTLLLKRAQDVLETVHGQPAPNRIMVDDYIKVPGPLYHTLDALGTYHSNVDGIHYTVVPPAIPAVDPPDYWVVDEELIENWSRLISRSHSKFEFFTLPAPDDIYDRSILLTSSQADGQYISGRAFTNETKPEDTVLALVNDNLFTPGHITFDNCQYNTAKQCHAATLRTSFVDSFALTSTS